MNIEKRKYVIMWYFFLPFAPVAHLIPICYFVQPPPYLTSKLNQRFFLRFPCGSFWFLPFFLSLVKSCSAAVVFSFSFDLALLS